LPPKEIPVLDSADKVKALVERATTSDEKEPTIVFIGLAKEKENDFHKTFEKLARSDDLEDMAEFYLAFDNDIFKSYGKVEGDGVAVLKPFDEKYEMLQDGLKEGKLASWMKKNLLPHFAVANKYAIIGCG